MLEQYYHALRYGIFNNYAAYVSPKPKTFVNWVLFDEQFQFVSASSGSEQVGADGALTTHTKTNLPITKNGYLYVYVSNETTNQYVYFDNLQVTHIRGPLLEENHYYPYGLKIAGISSKAINGPANAWQYQGVFSDYDDLSGYNDFALRSYDAQTGRWTSQDPYDEFPSPYLGMGGNPVSYADPDGGCEFCETASRALTLPTVVVSSTPVINWALVHTGVNVFFQGVAAGVNMSVDWINHNLNPVYGAFNGVQAQFTQKDFLSGQPMSRLQGGTDAVLSAFPAGTIEGAFEKTFIRSFERTATEEVTKVVIP